MDTEKHLEEIVYSLKKLAERLEKTRISDDTIGTKVELFMSEIDWALANLDRNLLVRRLVRDLAEKEGNSNGNG